MTSHSILGQIQPSPFKIHREQALHSRTHTLVSLLCESILYIVYVTEILVVCLCYSDILAKGRLLCFWGWDEHHPGLSWAVWQHKMGVAIAWLVLR